MTRAAIPRPCACGCGQPTVGRSRYLPQHLAVMVAARRRLRETRRYATKRGIWFDLDLETVHALVASSWPRDAELSLRRMDPQLGFIPGNVTLVPTSGGRRRAPTNARLRRRLERLACRADLAGVVDVHELAEVFVAQEGLCWVSGRPLRPDARLEDPDGIALVLKDTARPASPKNVALVTTAVAHAARWGVGELLGLAHDIVARDAQRHTARSAAAGRTPERTRPARTAR